MTAHPAAMPDGFQPCTPALRPACLRLFDANCPTWFAPNERADYAAFLEQAGPAYFVMEEAGEIIAAFGLRDQGVPGRRRLSWIMVSPAKHGAGLGRRIMGAVSALSAVHGVELVDIAASHLSAPFFARFGATVTRHVADGWGAGMHRVDMEWVAAD